MTLTDWTWLVGLTIITLGIAALLMKANKRNRK